MSMRRQPTLTAAGGPAGTRIARLSSTEEGRRVLAGGMGAERRVRPRWRSRLVRRLYEAVAAAFVRVFGPPSVVLAYLAIWRAYLVSPVPRSLLLLGLLQGSGRDVLDSLSQQATLDWWTRMQPSMPKSVIR